MRPRESGVRSQEDRFFILLTEHGDRCAPEALRAWKRPRSDALRASRTRHAHLGPVSRPAVRSGLLNADDDRSTRASRFSMWRHGHTQPLLKGPGLPRAELLRFDNQGIIKIA